LTREQEQKAIRELAAQLRQTGLHIFRHRRGMLFVSPIRVRPFVQDGAAISPLVKTILDRLSATPRINRKELAEKVALDSAAAAASAKEAPAGEEEERAKLALASDLKWLISEGYVIEFNDGSLDLPRAKAKAKETVVAAVSAANDGSAESRPSENAPENRQEEVTAPAMSSEAEIGGS